MIESIAPKSEAAFRISDRTRSQVVASAGVAVLLLSVAAALLPVVDDGSRAGVIGAMMVIGGLGETVAGSLRRRDPSIAMIPGAMTIIAGVVFAFEPFDKFVPAVWLVIVWLGARSVVLGAAASVQTRGSIRGWTAVAAATDFSLGAILMLGLSASTLSLTLFGLTPEILRGFSWVLALSFVATGMLLIEVAGCDRHSRWALRSLLRRA